MNEGVICNGISWQQWRIVCRDVRIVAVDGHYRRTLRFRHTGTSSSRQKTCQPTWFVAECMPRELLRWQKAIHSNSRPPIELLRAANRNAAAVVGNRILPPTPSCRSKVIQAAGCLDPTIIIPLSRWYKTRLHANEFRLTAVYGIFILLKANCTGCLESQ